MYFIFYSILSCCIYSKKSRIGHCIFILTDYIQSNFVFNIVVPREYFDFFDSGKIRISVFYLGEHIDVVYILQKRVEKAILYFFCQIIFRAILLLTLGCLENIQIFFSSGKIRISVFQMRGHIELVYILQNRVEKGIVYFVRQTIFRAILLLTLGCLDNIQIIFDSRKVRILVFYMREHTELVYIL